MLYLRTSGDARQDITLCKSYLFVVSFFLYNPEKSKDMSSTHQSIRTTKQGRYVGHNVGGPKAIFYLQAGKSPIQLHLQMNQDSWADCFSSNKSTMGFWFSQFCPCSYRTIMDNTFNHSLSLIVERTAKISLQLSFTTDS